MCAQRAASVTHNAKKNPAQRGALCQSYRRQIGEWGLGAPECRDPITLLAARLKNLNKWRRNAWRHLIGGTVRNLSSWPLDPVVHDLSRFPKGFGRGRKRHRCRQPQPIFIVYRHDETRLASEIETMEMVSLRLEDHGLPSHAVLNASSLARGSPRNPAIMRALREARRFSWADPFLFSRVGLLRAEIHVSRRLCVGRLPTNDRGHDQRQQELAHGCCLPITG